MSPDPSGFSPARFILRHERLPGPADSSASLVGEAAEQSEPPRVDDPVHPESPIAFLIVKSMLLTGFDAPLEQALYLDRPIRDAELLQAVARVNRPMSGKEVGYVVDYYGVFEHLSSALPSIDRPTWTTP